jgi:hypothetical protein
MPAPSPQYGGPCPLAVVPQFEFLTTATIDFAKAGMRPTRVKLISLAPASFSKWPSVSIDKCLHREEFDVAAGPKRREMAIHLAGYSKREIL